MPEHDNSDKLLFSHPEMVRDLLVGFVEEPWVEELDLTTLEKASGSYVADDLRDREDDVIWRVRFRERWLYLLLLEFQSSTDPWMPVRILTYLGLLYQDLIQQGSIAKGDKLPPVLPIVLYNGKPRWQAATQIADLIEPAPGTLAEYTPQLKYLLLDEGALDESGPWALNNLVAALFRLEKSRAPENIESILGALIEWTQDWKQQGLQQGRQEGLQQGKVALLERLLSKRFGPLNEPTRSRLNNATLMHREEDRLIIEPLRRRGLLATLAKLPTLEEEFPDVDRGLLPLDSPE